MHTMEFLGVKLDFEYESSPAEARTHTDPGCESEFNIIEVYAGGVEITELLNWNCDVFCQDINNCAIKALEDS